MKKFAAVLLGLIVVLGLAGCGGGGSAPTTAAGGAETPTTAAGPKGEVVNVGEFEVFVPEGWMKFPQTDLFGEEDADGNKPVLTDSYGMIKGGESEIDALLKPTLYVYYYKDFDAQTQYDSTKFMADEPKDIDVTINGTKCLAFEADSFGYVSQYIFYPVSDKTCFQFLVPTDLDGTPGVSVDDADVRAILESVKVK